MSQDIFVSDADLSAERPPPNQRTGIQEIIQSRWFFAVVSVLYLLFVSSALVTRDITTVTTDVDVQTDRETNTQFVVETIERSVSSEEKTAIFLFGSSDARERTTTETQTRPLEEGDLVPAEVETTEFLVDEYQNISLAGLARELRILRNYQDLEGFSLENLIFGTPDALRYKSRDVINDVATSFFGTPLPNTEEDLTIDEIAQSNSSNFFKGYLLAFIASIPFGLLVLFNSLREQRKFNIVFYRNILFIRDIIQVAMLIFFLGSGYGLLNNLDNNLASSDIIVNFEVLKRDFGVEISEGPSYEEPLEWNVLGNKVQGEDIPIVGEYLAPKTNVRAILQGVSNTLKAVVWALVFATILGVMLGIGLLSNNWLIRNISTIYTEIFRNTPLLVQLFFVINSLQLLLPEDREPIEFNPFGFIARDSTIYIHKQGINYPKFVPSDGYFIFMGMLLIGVVIGLYLRRERLKIQDETGQPAYGMRFLLGSIAVFGLIGLLQSYSLADFPFTVEQPVKSRFGFDNEFGGFITVQLLSLIVGLVLYTAAFIADIVRAGIQSVPNGQIEAARAAGLTSGQTLQLVVLPQAMRLIVPPLTNQYLNLAKNSSLGIVVAYSDIFNVVTIASNQSGQVIVFFLFMMVTYLLLSLVISALMNAFNRRLRLQSR